MGKSYTKEEQRAYDRAWYAKNKAKRIAINKAYALRNAGYISKLKLETGCTDCGYNKHAEALEYDHTEDNKSFDVGSAVARAYSIKRILEEIAKCELVCANCHRVRTSERRKLRLLSSVG